MRKKTNRKNGKVSVEMIMKIKDRWTNISDRNCELIKLIAYSVMGSPLELYVRAKYIKKSGGRVNYSRTVIQENLKNSNSR